MRRLTEVWRNRRASTDTSPRQATSADGGRRDTEADEKRQAISPEQFDRSLLDVLARG